MKINCFALMLALLIPISSMHKIDIADLNHIRSEEEVIDLNPAADEKNEKIDFIDEEKIEDPIDENTNIEGEKIDIIKFNVNGLNLKAGISSEEVLRVKKFFKLMGYTEIIEDYYFDNEFKDIVMKYQMDKGLVSDGIIGPNTYAKINEDMEINKINICYEEMGFNADIPMGQWIIINKSNNTLYHLNGNEVINKYPVATGKSPLHTPEGKFSIVIKSINPAWGGAGIHKPVRGGAPNNPLGKRWLGLSIKGGGTYGIHGNAAPQSIGTYASLGCVRMFNEDVENLYDLIQYGTPVWIGNEFKLNEFGIVYGKDKISNYCEYF
ncbi:L,D-transpeptidase family protein [Paratissierella segnis]|uniref:Murein L,D-transpeptidase n=1 Tax=Paratissierella segnis TaxID=2763679 RepID=A0A926ESH7_9FIRM|nr:L,D-transpeptidase family protein [Paratissierella segnis]MBC8587408.1 murein L,D-transpeptidase [Paratissierella segnis]